MKLEGAGVPVALAIALICCAFSFGAGRFTAPEVTRTRDVEKIVYKDRIVEKVITVEKAAKAETKVVYRDRIVTVDGTVTEREVEKTEAKETAETKTEADRAEVREVERLVTVEKEVMLRPDWRVTVQAGAALHSPLVPIAGPLVLGVEVDRRILGGVSAGAWVSTIGAAGVSVAVEF